VRFERADVQSLPFGDDAFEAVINANMVHLVPAPAAMLNEIERVLKPGGKLLITDLRRSWLGLVEAEIRSALTVNEVEELLCRTNLREGVLTSSTIWWRFSVFDDPTASRGLPANGSGEV
jgi:ubiquinone/menaquinone biosynthesis C-methylase UbiE